MSSSLAGGKMRGRRALFVAMDTRLVLGLPFHTLVLPAIKLRAAFQP
jgi:hypothetical protein